MPNLARTIDFMSNSILVYEQKLRKLSNEELDKEFSKAIFSNAKDPMYKYKCMAIEKEFMRRGLVI